ncbi:hypothetical protein [Azospirillum argentinense]
MTTDSRLIPRAPIPARSRDRNAKTAKVFVLTLMSFMVCFSLFCRVGGRLPRAFTKGAFLYFCFSSLKTINFAMNRLRQNRSLCDSEEMPHMLPHTRPHG